MRLGERQRLLAAQSLAYVPMPVPEPRAWLLLAVGLGIVGTAVCRRRR